ncbi:MAG: hypothetical protein LBS62_13640 [Clostridiales bacterium]|jgi:hypothetical protein|nr:hypothetical protein [Clostridiales bacterium]
MADPAAQPRAVSDSRNFSRKERGENDDSRGPDSSGSLKFRLRRDRNQAVFLSFMTFGLYPAFFYKKLIDDINQVYMSLPSAREERKIKFRAFFLIFTGFWFTFYALRGWPLVYYPCQIICWLAGALYVRRKIIALKRTLIDIALYYGKIDISGEINKLGINSNPPGQPRPAVKFVLTAVLCIFVPMIYIWAIVPAFNKLADEYNKVWDLAPPDADSPALLI